jgi:thiol-disulfide isomerase/thioredoxin
MGVGMNYSNPLGFTSNVRVRLGQLFRLTFLLTAVQVCAQATPSPLSIGASAPDFALPGVDGKVHKLSDYATSKVLVVAFLCNHCTASQLYEGRIQKLADDYRSKGVSLIAIEADNPDSVPIEDLAYTDVGDSLADMKERATYQHLTFPYLYDGETQKVAKLYGPTVAPQIFIFDQARKLRYEGRIDDGAKETPSQTSEARNALDALLGGRPVTVTQTTATGCAIRWATKSAEGQAEKAKLVAEPVNVALAGPEDLKKLRANEAGKMLLVNFYATWCGPCVSEFPDLMATSRMYRGRGLVLTTVSSNEPDERPDVLKFLQKMHASTTTNLLFGTTDTYALQAAFDPNMGAGVPFTVLIAPDGEILYQEVGELDMMKLRRAILANLPEDKNHEGSHTYWAAR